MANIPIPDVVTKKDLSISEFITSLDDVHHETALLRKQLTDKLFTVVNSMEIDTEGDPEKLESHIRLLDQADKLLMNREKAMINRINVRLKNKETDIQEKLSSAMTAKVLREVKTSYVADGTDEVNLEVVGTLEEQLSQLEKVEYNDGALRFDSKDIS